MRSTGRARSDAPQFPVRGCSALALLQHCVQGNPLNLPSVVTVSRLGSSTQLLQDELVQHARTVRVKASLKGGDC